MVNGERFVVFVAGVWFGLTLALIFTAFGWGF